MKHLKHLPVALAGAGLAILAMVLYNTLFVPERVNPKDVEQAYLIKILREQEPSLSKIGQSTWSGPTGYGMRTPN